MWERELLRKAPGPHQGKEGAPTQKAAQEPNKRPLSLGTCSIWDYHALCQLISVVGKTMASQRGPCPHSRKLVLMLNWVAKGIEVADGLIN